MYLSRPPVIADTRSSGLKVSTLTPQGLKHCLLQRTFLNVLPLLSNSNVLLVSKKQKIYTIPFGPEVYVEKNIAMFQSMNIYNFQKQIWLKRFPLLKKREQSCSYILNASMKVKKSYCKKRIASIREEDYI